MEEEIFIRYGILFFIFITLLILVCLVLYYILPSNYLIIENKDLILIDTKILTINPYSEMILNYSDYNNKILKFDNKEIITLIFYNFFKSQTLNYKDFLIKPIFKSNIKIVNSCNNQQEIIMNIYSKN